MESRNLPEIEEFFDCASSIEDLSVYDIRRKSSDSSKVSRKAFSHSAQKGLPKLLSSNYLSDLPSIQPVSRRPPVSDFTNTKLIQDLELANKGLIEEWTVSFSTSGLLLALAGHRFIYIYEVEANVNEPPRLFRPVPSLFSELDEEISCVAWTANDQLLIGFKSGALTRYAIDRPLPLSEYLHPETITSVLCHPTDAQIFVTACSDCIIRVFNTDGSVLGYYQTAFSPTCLCLSPDCGLLAVGLSKGEVMLYKVLEKSRLRLQCSLNCRNAKGLDSGGRRVTGIDMAGGFVLVSTNDSRIRLFQDGKLVHKFKGHKNRSAYLRASFSRDRKYVCSGSQDGKVVVWKCQGEGGVKVKEFESFRVREGKKCEYAMFMNEGVMEQFRAVYRTQGVNFRDLILTVASRGTLRVYVNYSLSGSLN
jgi:WD40 repeat protein